MNITFEAFGEPVCQGSMRIRYVNGEPRIEHDSAELPRWRSAIKLAARHALGSAPAIPRLVPVIMDVTFRVSRPLTGRGGKVLGLEWPTQDRDTDKLSRALCDALTNVLYADDGQVIDLHARKRYANAGELPGAVVAVSTVKIGQKTLALEGAKCSQGGETTACR